MRTRQSMYDVLVTVVGGFGFVLLLSAFGLNLARKLNQSDLAYSALNMFGAAAMAWYASVKDAFVFVALEGIWAFVAAVTALIAIRRRRRQSRTIESRHA